MIRTGCGLTGPSGDAGAHPKSVSVGTLHSADTPGPSRRYIECEILLQWLRRGVD